jgi:hypothetical protein
MVAPGRGAVVSRETELLHRRLLRARDASDVGLRDPFGNPVRIVEQGG